MILHRTHSGHGNSGEEAVWDVIDPFVRIRVGQELPRRRHIGKTALQVERDAPDKLGVGGSGERHAVCLRLLFYMAVDQVFVRRQQGQAGAENEKGASQHTTIRPQFAALCEPVTLLFNTLWDPPSNFRGSCTRELGLARAGDRRRTALADANDLQCRLMLKRRKS